MSGLCGIVRLDGADVSEVDLERQTRALAHRGPDRVRRRVDGPAGFGALLMKVNREDAFDDQPLYDSPSGLLFVADARIDNREAVAAALSIPPSTLAGLADSTLIFEAYKAWGEDCVERLIGDYVFAAWNADTKTLTLARDPMGGRHVFFHRGDGFFAFASERRGLFALPDVPRILSVDMFGMVVTEGGGQQKNRTLAGSDGVGAVPGGTIVKLGSDGELSSRRYWSPRADPRHENRDEAYYVQAYREVLGEAVACRLRRLIRPAGLMMSGGFDSTAICALAGPVLKDKGQKLIAVASVMPADYAGDIQHARAQVETVRAFMPHLDVKYVTREGLDIFTDMERAFLNSEDSHSPNRYVNDAMYAEMAKAGARTAMDGHGGDYTLNPRGLRGLIRLLKAGRLRTFAREWQARRRFTGHTHYQIFRSSIRPFLFPKIFRALARVGYGLKPFGPSMPLSTAVLRRLAAQEREQTSAKPATMRESLLRGLNTVVGASAMGGAISAAHHGLEFTQPFHDKRVVELALAIPEDYFMKNGRERYLARLALKDFYPPEFQHTLSNQHDIGPDFLQMIKRIEPRLLSEIDRMEAGGKLDAYFDFPRMRRMLTRRTLDQHASGNEFDTRQAALAFLWARYIEWFRRDNT